MKKLVYLFLVGLGLTVLSCQPETDLPIETEVDLSFQLDPQIVDTNSAFENSSRKGGVINSQVFENYMQWFSFITAKLLRNNSTYQTEFINLLGTGDVIVASDVIGDGPFFSNFHSDFRTTLINYLDYNNPEPDDEPVGPDPPTTPVTGIDAVVLADQMIDYLANEQCVELYFPKGLNFQTEPYTIGSSAHPLTLASTNPGIRRLSQPQPFTTYVTEAITMEFSYLINPQNTMVIIARPTRHNLSGTGNSCTYNEYEDIDFHLFPQ